MSRTITALFDSRSDAEAAQARLTSSRIDASNIRIVDQSYGGEGSTSGEGGGFFASLKEFFLPDEDAQAYGEGISRGGYLLCARVDEDQADEAIAILDQDPNSVDFDQRQEEWRSQGWTGGYSSPGGSAGGTEAFGSFDSERSEQVVDEERIPIVEEELQVGKREVARGGARVRSYVRETPVHEQVNLREEHVNVERRPVNRELSSEELRSGDLLRDQDIEMTETSEEAVIGKEARVREELVVRKTAEERTEQIDDTVRRTEVEVDEGSPRGEERPAFGSFGSDSPSREREGESRSDFERTDKNRF